MTWQDVLEIGKGFAVWLWSMWQAKMLVFHIAGNFVIAIAVAIRTKEFQLDKVAEFTYRKVLPLIGVYAFFSFAAQYTELSGAIATATWIVLETSLTADLLDNLAKLGVQLPKALIKSSED